MKILLTGSTGQLGKAITNQKPNNHHLLVPKRDELDLSNRLSCQRFLESNKPDFIINSGAYTNVDLAEKQIDLCSSINTEAPFVFANMLKKNGGNLLQISTDYVFDGCKNSPYKVNDIKNPISKYGYSKARSEELIEEILTPTQQVVILRTSWLLGSKGKNFLLKMLELHQNKKEFSVVSDQIGSMSSTEDVAKVCWEIISNWELFSNKSNYINHWTCQGVASWYDIAIEIGDIATKCGILKSPAKIHSINSENYPTLAKRPKYSILDCSTTREIIGIEGKYWRQELEKIIRNMANKQ